MKKPPYQHIATDLEIGETEMRKAAEQFGTPLYLYDARKLEHNYLELRSFIPNTVTIYYSPKANPNKWITELFYQNGANVEAASLGELMMLKERKVLGERIILVGPGKSNELLEAAVEYGIACLVVESAGELDRLHAIAAKKKKQVHTAFRINPCFGSGSMLTMSGNTQFGMDEEEVLRYLKSQEAYPFLKFSGMHVYLGTEITGQETFLWNTIEILEIAKRMQEQSGIKFEFVDIGGGLGIPYFEKEIECDLSKIKDRLSSVVEAYQKTYPETRIALESGRYLTGNAGIFLTQVMDKKEVKGKRYAILDGGTNNLLYSSQYGARIPPMQVIGKKHGELERVTFCGPLCTPTDRMALDAEVPPCKTGDLIAFYQAGAYGTTIAPGLFLSHGFPSEVLYTKGRLELIRRRVGWKEILEMQEV